MKDWFGWRVTTSFGHVVAHAFVTGDSGSGSLCGQVRLPVEAPVSVDEPKCGICLRSWRKRYPATHPLGPAPRGVPFP
jgi:hypothetical protein